MIYNENQSPPDIVKFSQNQLFIQTPTSSLCRMSRMGGTGRIWGTFYIGEIKIVSFFQTRKFSKIVKKTMRNLQIWGNFQIYIQKSQWKTDFLLIFSPIFVDFCHFIHLRNIPKFLGLVWGVNWPPTPRKIKILFWAILH